MLGPVTVVTEEVIGAKVTRAIDEMGTADAMAEEIKEGELKCEDRHKHGWGTAIHTYRY